jgi:hypothetical protein
MESDRQAEVIVFNTVFDIRSTSQGGIFDNVLLLGPSEPRDARPHIGDGSLRMALVGQLHLHDGGTGQR